jgi:multidrug efflux pump subunit AcrA (membrane-fusion protein)
MDHHPGIETREVQSMSRAAALLLLLPALAACRAEGAAEAPATPAPRPVQVAEIVLAPAESHAAYTGTVRARREVDVGFRAGGRIAARLVEVGETVEAGQELARLDPADLALALRAAEADLAAPRRSRARPPMTPPGPASFSPPAMSRPPSTTGARRRRVRRRNASPPPARRSTSRATGCPTRRCGRHPRAS